MTHKVCPTTQVVSSGDDVTWQIMRLSLSAGLFYRRKHRKTRTSNIGKVDQCVKQREIKAEVETKA